MERLVGAGIRTGVLLSPVMPGITDSASNLEAVVRAAADHGAHFLGTRILYLQPGIREHFTGFLKREYPDLLSEYQRLYPGSYTPKRFRETVRHQVALLKETHTLRDRPTPEPLRLKQLTFEV